MSGFLLAQCDHHRPIFGSIRIHVSIYADTVYPRKKYLKFFIDVDNYNDMAKTWMQNPIYNLKLQGQSCMHKNVHQIVQNLKKKLT